MTPISNNLQICDWTRKFSHSFSLWSQSSGKGCMSFSHHNCFFKPVYLKVNRPWVGLSCLRLSSLSLFASLLLLLHYAIASLLADGWIGVLLLSGTFLLCLVHGKVTVSRMEVDWFWGFFLFNCYCYCYCFGHPLRRCLLQSFLA